MRIACIKRNKGLSAMESLLEADARASLGSNGGSRFQIYNHPTQLDSSICKGPPNQVRKNCLGISSWKTSSQGCCRVGTWSSELFDPLLPVPLCFLSLLLVADVKFCFLCVFGRSSSNRATIPLRLSCHSLHDQIALYYVPLF